MKKHSLAPSESSFPPQCRNSSLWRHITVYETCEVNGPFKGEMISYWIFHSIQFIVYWSLLKGSLTFVFFIRSSIMLS
jgi:hypothetical protein